MRIVRNDPPNRGAATTPQAPAAPVPVPGASSRRPHGYDSGVMGLRSLDRRNEVPVPTLAPRADLTVLQALIPLTEVPRLPAQPVRSVVSDQGALTVRQKIAAYVDELRSHLRNHTEPEPRDHLFLDVLARSENIRTPGLNLRILRLAQSPLHAVAQALVDAPPPGIGPGALQWQAVVDDGGHRVAASVRIDGDDPGRVSVILIDPRLKGAKRHDGHAANSDSPAQPTLSQTLDSKGLKLQVTYMSTDEQRNPGCTILALTAVKKMHGSAAIDQIHSDALAAAAERPEVFGAEDHKLLNYSSSIESERIAFFEAALALPGLGLDEPWGEPPKERDFAAMLQVLKGMPSAPAPAQTDGLDKARPLGPSDPPKAEVLDLHIVLDAVPRPLPSQA